MSRSRKKPYISWACAGGKAGAEKFFKNYANRKMRRKKLSLPARISIAFKNSFMNIWSYPKDGKTYYDTPNNRRK